MTSIAESLCNFIVAAKNHPFRVIVTTFPGDPKLVKKNSEQVNAVISYSNWDNN